MEFLGYKIGNGYTHLDYDNDGFLVGDTIELLTFISPDNKSNMYHVSIECLGKTDEYYQYKINVIGESNYGDSVAYGNVKIYYDSDSKLIKSVFVNDVKNANLCDKYDDVFEIGVSSYINLLYNHYIEFDANQEMDFEEYDDDSKE
jgi:hypothetical protein